MKVWLKKALPFMAHLFVIVDFMREQGVFVEHYLGWSCSHDCAVKCLEEDTLFIISQWSIAQW